MRKELDEALCAKYPKIFRDRHGDMRSTAMVWGFPGDGWYNIIDAACARIQNHINNHNNNIEFLKKWNSEITKAHAGDWSFLYEKYASEKSRAWLEQNLEAEQRTYLIDLREVPKPMEQIVATQVKEKYGTLRFYVSHSDEFIDGVIAMAESMSTRTCETCGAPGKRRGGGWLYTACDEHTKAEDIE